MTNQNNTSKRCKVPFQVRALLRQDNLGQDLPVGATVDGGAILRILDCTYWAGVEAKLGLLAKLNIICQMANGHCEKSAGRGMAQLGVAGLWLPIQFEVLESQGAFEILLRKTWLHNSGAVQIFDRDRLTILGPQGLIKLQNKHPLLDRPASPEADAKPSIEPTLQANGIP
ncbi:Retrovirus-related Pol polyprotein from transposon opus [Ceratobasidium sp. AG-Ba]|nr:Retrovirus-related Pol polyprotein from transposon opus [Ceratobasidium sp. AG-Ba]